MQLGTFRMEYWPKSFIDRSKSIFLEGRAPVQSLEQEDRHATLTEQGLLLKYPGVRVDSATANFGFDMIVIPNKRFGFGVWLPLDEDVQDISSPYAVVLLLYFHDIRIELFHYL